MTFNYSHEMDDYEAMLIDAKNDARTAVREEVRTEDFKDSNRLEFLKKFWKRQGALQKSRMNNVSVLR